MSNSLRPHEPQHARPPCPSPTPGVHSYSCPLSQWCHPAILSSVVPFSSWHQSLPASVFFNKSTLHMRWPKYWSFSFSISPSNEHPGLISFRMDCLDLLAVDSILKSRDITLPTKVHLVNAMVFPVVMYGCELDCEEGRALKNWCFWTVVLEKTLESPLECKEIQPLS